jgi:putative ABC transport system ATP-binding protein
LIEFADVHKTYPQGGREVRALDGLTLRIEAGALTAVVGPSGSGKSTLLHLAAGLDLPTRGTVAIDGRATASMSDDELTLLRRNRIGLVFQFFYLIPTLRVVENVSLPLLLGGARQREVRPRVQALLESLGLGDRGERFPEELSGGEMQRVAIARALVVDPAVVLADEPTGNLDSATGRGVLAILRGVAEREGRTVVMVTHDEHAAEAGHRTVRLCDGRLDGAPR